MTHKITKTEVEGWYTYRGVTIKRDDSAKGYWGHWYATCLSSVTGERVKISTEKRKQLLEQIDFHLDNPTVSQ